MKELHENQLGTANNWLTEILYFSLFGVLLIHHFFHLIFDLEYERSFLQMQYVYIILCCPADGITFEIV